MKITKGQLTQLIEQSQEQRNSLDSDLPIKSETDINEYNESSNYMFFSNLKKIKRQAELLLELNQDKVDEILNDGHDWADDHISSATENMDQVFDFMMGIFKDEDVNPDEWNEPYKAKSISSDELNEQFGVKRKRVVFNNGGSISMQASNMNYSNPQDNEGPYNSIELGYPSKGTELPQDVLDHWENINNDPHTSIFAYVPAEAIKKLIDANGGIKSGDVPPLVQTDDAEHEEVGATKMIGTNDDVKAEKKSDDDYLDYEMVSEQIKQKIINNFKRFI
jgi:hypothetical protein